MTEESTEECTFSGMAIEERQKFPLILVWHMESATSLSCFYLLNVYITGSARSALPVTLVGGPYEGTRCRLRLIGLACEDLKAVQLVIQCIQGVSAVHSSDFDIAHHSESLILRPWYHIQVCAD